MSDPALELELADECAEFYDDPYGWALWAFDWGHGELKGHELDTWQVELLQEWGREIRARGFDGVNSVMPIRMVRASGHGIGKSALVAIVLLFIMSTRPHARGTITANTGDQLRSKTFPEISKWRKLCLTGHWFEMNLGKGSLAIYHKDDPENWRADGLTCREENSEAFAGLHNASSSPFYIFDEASNIPDLIWEVSDGGLTDGEPFFFAFGNPTRNTGRFKETFTDSRYLTAQIDSRTAKMTNKEYLNELVDKHGEDSDVVRVRVRGMFPKAGDHQFFPESIVEQAMRRQLPYQLPDEALICGIDYSRGGLDNSVVQFRRGKDAKSETRYVIPAEKTQDSMKVVSLLTMVLERHKPDYIFGDVGGIGGPINDRLRQLGFPIVDVGFGHSAGDSERFANMTSEMCYRLLEWLQTGGCLPNVPTLKDDLTSREYYHDSKDRLMMESKRVMKRRIGRSPDDMDALLLTFAMPVVSSLGTPRDDRPVGAREVHVTTERYNPLERLAHTR